jgi:hypothetical protein
VEHSLGRRGWSVPGLVGDVIAASRTGADRRSPATESVIALAALPASSRPRADIEGKFIRAKMTDLTAQTIKLLPGDETVLKYLGAAVVLQWHSFPEAVQAALLRQADSIGGLPLAGELQEKTRELLRRTRA